MYAYVPDDASRRYDPPAPDLTSSTPAPDDVGRGVAAPTGDQQRVIFTELVRQIEEYAVAHRQAEVLKVTAHTGTPWWVWFGLGLVLLKGGRRRR